MNGDHLLGQAVQRAGSRKFHLAAGVAILLIIMAMSPRALAQAAPMGPVTEAFSDTNPCTQETFTGTAKTFVLMYTRIDTTGTHFLFRIMSHAEATVILTGVKYVANAEDTNETDLPLTGLREFTVVLGEVLVRQGNTATTDLPNSTTLGDDFVSNLVTHVTINANGVVTADFSRGPFKCTQ